MKFYTGDEAGLIKEINVPLITTFSPLDLKRKQKHQDDEHKEDPKTDNEAQNSKVSMRAWGSIDKDSTVQCMEFVTYKAEEHMVIARRNGLVQFVSLQDGKVVREIRESTVFAKNGAKFVGLYANERETITCTDMGTLTITPHDSNTNPSYFDLGSNICKMRIHPSHPHLMAVGGKEHELTLYDLRALCEGKVVENADDKKEKAKYERKKEKEKGIIWKAKNVKNDFLDLRVPVWIVDLQFVSSDGNKIAIATQYHQIRVYDIQVARRPILNVEIGEHPFLSLGVNKNYSELVCSDTATNVYSISLQDLKITGQYKGFSGAASQVITFTNSDNSKSYVATVGHDRFLRVHEFGGMRRLVRKVYLKQRMTCLLAKMEEETQDKNEPSGDEEDEELWENMDKVVGDRNKRKKRLKKE
ncbi:uncharacterized protein VTP21DRAFT_6521 [Calcarisporiella thermophila]|uniref:uncharacterized protein n=1 Tax=Calcarisporiella thermophila TaxID=911321 RepID=UPI003742DFB3